MSIRYSREMTLTPAERQARHRQRLKDAANGLTAYDVELLRKQVALLEDKLNETRAHIGLPEIQIPRSAYAQKR